jgi:hypothetical protein
LSLLANTSTVRTAVQLRFNGLILKSLAGRLFSRCLSKNSFERRRLSYCQIRLMDPLTFIGGAVLGGKVIEKVLGPTADYVGQGVLSWTQSRVFSEKAPFLGVDSPRETGTTYFLGGGFPPRGGALGIFDPSQILPFSLGGCFGILLPFSKYPSVSGAICSSFCANCYAEKNKAAKHTPATNKHPLAMLQKVVRKSYHFASQFFI